MTNFMIHARADEGTLRDLDARLRPGATRSDLVRAAVFSFIHRPVMTADELLTKRRHPVRDGADGVSKLPSSDTHVLRGGVLARKDEVHKSVNGQAQNPTVSPQGNRVAPRDEGGRFLSASTSNQTPAGGSDLDGQAQRSGAWSGVDTEASRALASGGRAGAAREQMARLPGLVKTAQPRVHSDEATTPTEAQVWASDQPAPGMRVMRMRPDELHGPDNSRWAAS